MSSSPQGRFREKLEMTFEITDKDLAGRIGRLETRRGTIETPYLFPVINPFDKTVSVEDINRIGFNAFITNILHVRRAIKELGVMDVHELLGFAGPVMTDSGAYQLLVYGRVDVTPREVIELQEKCGSDIAVILDFPTGDISYDEAQRRVHETLERAKELQALRSDGSVLWVGPVQGAPYLDLVERCARELARLNFDIYAVGSPTKIMESYNYKHLLDVVYKAKSALPLGKPVHLFGAGHPMMLSLAVALGCDLFDSASYVLYAKEDRYMTPYGTLKVDELEYLPCSCPLCSRLSARDLTSMPRKERVRTVALHNLYVLMGEVKNIKQSIREGRLWEYVSLKSKAHPRLFSAFSKFRVYSSFFESLDPVTKASSAGLFFYEHRDIFRPEVERHIKRLSRASRYFQGKVLLLLPRDDASIASQGPLKRLLKDLGEAARGNAVQILLYGFPFCLIPLELHGVYPLSQYEVAGTLDPACRILVSRRIARILEALKPKGIVLCNDVNRWGHSVERACRQACANVRVLNLSERMEGPLREKMRLMLDALLELV